MAQNELRGSGYSGTPLVRKLGFLATDRVVLVGAPREYSQWLADSGEPPTCKRVKELARAAPFARAHLFVDDSATLAVLMKAVREGLTEEGFVWVSWPKKSSKIPTDVTEDVVRALALPLGLVDVKVCAVNDVWSGLKLYVRRTERNKNKAGSRTLRRRS